MACVPAGMEDEWDEDEGIGTGGHYRNHHKPSVGVSHGEEKIQGSYVFGGDSLIERKHCRTPSSNVGKEGCAVLPSPQTHAKHPPAAFLRQKRGYEDERKGKKGAKGVLETLLSGVETKADVVGIFGREGVSMQSFLHMGASDFEKLGIVDEEDQAVLAEVIVEIHKEPFQEGSLVQPPPFLPQLPHDGQKPMSAYYPTPHQVLVQKKRPPEWSCVSLGGMLENIRSQMVHMESGIMTAQRLMAAYSIEELSEYGYTDENKEALVKEIRRVKEEGERLKAGLLSMSSTLAETETGCGVWRSWRVGGVVCLLILGWAFCPWREYPGFLRQGCDFPRV